MAKLKSPTYIGGVPIDPTGPVTGDALVWDGAQFIPANVSGFVPFLMPVGSLQMYAGSGVPTNWLRCDGASVLQADHAELFAVLGTIYGSVDGTHFNVPDLQQRFPVGAQPSVLNRGVVGGEASHVLTGAEVGAHGHAVGTLQNAAHGHADTIAVNNDGSHSHNFPSQTAAASHSHLGTIPNLSRSATDSGGFGTAISTAAGLHDHAIAGGVTNAAAGTPAISGSVATSAAATAHENRPPFIAVYFHIYRGEL